MRGFKRISSEIITVLLDLRFVNSFLLLQFEGVLILINTEIIITKVVKTFILHDALIFSLIRELCIFFRTRRSLSTPSPKVPVRAFLRQCPPGESNTFSTFTTDPTFSLVTEFFVL